MNTFHFVLTLADRAVCSDELAEAIYEAGGDDTTVASSDGAVRVYFHREGETLDQAIRSAVATLRVANCSVSAIEIDEDTVQLLTA